MHLQVHAETFNNPTLVIDPGEAIYKLCIHTFNLEKETIGWYKIAKVAEEAERYPQFYTSSSTHEYYYRKYRT